MLRGLYTTGVKRVLPVYSRRCFSNFVAPEDDDAFAKIRLMDGKKVYYFTAEWCPPCRRIGPVLEEIAKEYPDMLFVKINVDNMPLSAQYGDVGSLPTFQFNDGVVELFKFIGADETKLRATVAELQVTDSEF